VKERGPIAMGMKFLMIFDLNPQNKATSVYQSIVERGPSCPDTLIPIL
jgi:hypothetical protein